MNKIDTYLNTKPTLKEAVEGYVVNEADKKLLLIDRFDPPSGLGKGKLAGVGGKIDGDELPENALKREAKEETTLEIIAPLNRGEVTYLWPEKPEWNMHVHIFVIRHYTGEAQYVEGETVRPLWVGLDCVPYDQMFADYRYFLPNVLDGEIINAIFLYENGIVAEKLVEVL